MRVQIYTTMLVNKHVNCKHWLQQHNTTQHMIKHASKLPIKLYNIFFKIYSPSYNMLQDSKSIKHHIYYYFLLPMLLLFFVLLMFFLCSRYFAENCYEFFRSGILLLFYLLFESSRVLQRNCRFCKEMRSKNIKLKTYLEFP